MGRKLTSNYIVEMIPQTLTEMPKVPINQQKTGCFIFCDAASTQKLASWDMFLVQIHQRLAPLRMTVQVVEKNVWEETPGKFSISCKSHSLPCAPKRVTKIHKWSTWKNHQRFTRWALLARSVIFFKSHIFTFLGTISAGTDLSHSTSNQTHQENRLL